MNRKFMSAVAAFSAVIMLAGCSSSDTDPGSNSGGSGGLSTSGIEPGSDNCTPVVVGTSSEKVNLMDELGAKFKDSPEASALGKCVSVFPINVPSGRGAEILGAAPSSWPLANEAYWPTVWSPASTIWTDRVAASGNDAYAGAKSFTKTPVVLGVPESMARALGYPDKPISLQDVAALISDPNGWASAGKPLWGSFKIAKTNPNTSTTGLSIILMQSYAAANKAKKLTVEDVNAAAEFSRTFESGAIHYGDTTGNVLKTLAAKGAAGSNGSYVSAVALEETSLFNYNKGNPDSHTVQPGEQLTPPREKLVAVYPSGGSMWSDNPAVTIDGPWVTGDQKAASDAFLAFLQTKPAQEILPKYGFRPLDSSIDVSQYLNGDLGIDPAQPTVTLPKPDPAVVSAAIDQWVEIRKPSAVLELIDISGSMDDPIGDGRSKLEGAIDGAKSTVGNFRSTDEIGVWAFTTGISDPEIGKNVAQVRPFSALGGDKERLQTAIEDVILSERSGTPLYDAISAGYDYMLKRAETGRINAIVVLSDGEDTDSRTSLDSLLVKINSSAKEGTVESPVRIFTIAYGEGADKDILARISKASGGQMFDASDPERIDAVFAQVINNF